MDSYTHSNHPAFLYQSMLADQYRMQSYRRAIEKVVKKGDVIVDLGTGTGVLAMMAVQAGAQHVYAVEVRPQIIPITQRIIEQNDMSGKITLIEGDARDIILPEKVDLILNELIGDFGTDENIHECVSSVAERYLKPTGKILPQKLETYLVPVTYNDEFQGLWCKGYQGLDLSYVSTLKCLEEAQMRILAHQPTELSVPALIESVSFEDIDLMRKTHHNAEFVIHSDGELQGFMGYFQSELADGIYIANYPVYPGCHWQTWHWPVYPARNVLKHELLSCTLETPENMVAQGWKLDWSIK